MRASSRLRSHLPQTDPARAAHALRVVATAVVIAVALSAHVTPSEAAESRKPGSRAPSTASDSSPAPSRRPKVSIGERLAQLEHWNPRVRQIAAESLSAYGDDARRIAVSSLIATLHDPDPGVRRAAAQTLGVLAPPWWSVSDGLIDALGDVDDLVRGTIIEQIAVRGEEPVPQLVVALDAPVVRRREAAALTLGAIGPRAEAARSRLHQALTDPNTGVQHAARGALDAIGEPPPPPEPPPSAAPTAPASPEPPTHGTWLVLPVSAGWAVSALSGAGAMLATVWLVARIRRRRRGDTGSRRRTRAAEAPAQPEILGVAELRRAIDKNLIRLRDPDEERRFRGVQGLAELGARAVPVLVQTLEDSDPEVRYWAVAALELIGPAASAAAPMLAELVGSEAEREDTRVYAAHALGRVGARAVPSVLVMLRSDRAETRRHAASTFQRLGAAAEASAAHLVAALDDGDPEVAGTVEEALAAMSPAIAGALATGIAHPSAAVRARAARLARRVGAASPEVVAALASACTDADPDVQEQAALSLQAIQPPAPLDGSFDSDDTGSSSTSGLLN